MEFFINIFWNKKQSRLRAGYRILLQLIAFLGFGMGLGLLLMVLIFGIELTAGWVTISDTFHTVNPEQPFILSILVFFVFFLCTGIAEELFYRGYQLTNLAEGLNFKATGSKNAIIFAIVLSSVVFGLGHLANPDVSLISTFNTVLAGIMLVAGFVLTGELAIPIGLHITWNFFQANVFGFPVSGKTFPAETATFFSIEQGGPDLWTGGSYGPEARLIGFWAMILGVILIVGWIRLRKGNIKIFIPIAEPLRLRRIKLI